MPKMSWQKVDTAIVGLRGGKGFIGVACPIRVRQLWRSPRPWGMLLARPGLAAQLVA
jgi:hypothetical protein